MTDSIAIIDIGSNSIKLLVANHTGTLFQQTLLTRIGTGLGKSDRLIISDENIQAATKSIVEFLKKAEPYAPSETIIVATSAVRDASNRAAFCQAIEEVVGVSVRALSGIEEATYVSKGITTDPIIKGLKDLLLFDLGGGSLELILIKKGEVVFAESLPLGAVRLTEQFIEDSFQPISPDAIKKISNKVKKALLSLDIDWDSLRKIPLVGLGGVLGCTRSALGIKSIYIKADDIEFLRDRLECMALTERLQLPTISKGRADIMPTALTIVLALMENISVNELIHSSCNLRYGLLKDWLDRRTIGEDTLQEAGKVFIAL